MRRVCLLVAALILNEFAFGQRLEGWDVGAEGGTRFDALIGSGINSFQWGQLRGDLSVPPRTSRHAYIRNIRVIDGGDPFGRVVVLWSGWEGNGGDRSEYWIRDGYKAPPVYEAAQVGQTWSSSNLFRIRLWNEQYFSWQSRRAVVSVYAANAPVPALVSYTAPSWTDLSGLDLLPNRPGIQVDPAQVSELSVSAQFGSYQVGRPWAQGLKRVVSLGNYATESRPSPFRDRVMLEAFLTVRVNGELTDYGASATHALEWTPLDNTVDRLIPTYSGSATVSLSGLPRGSVVSFDLNAAVRHLPFDRNGQPMPPPPRRPVDDLRAADRVFFDLRGLTYNYSGALSGGGVVTDEQAPPVCVPKQPGTLDIALNLSDFGLPFNITVALAGRAQSDDVVEWTVDVRPDLCISVEGVNVKIKRVWGKLTAQLTRQPFFVEPLCDRTFNLTAVPIGGDSGNWINGELYALCQEFSFTRVDVRARSIDYRAASGIDQEPPDPRPLYQFTRSQWVELILQGDVNDDGCVDDADLLRVLFAFGQSGASLPEDQNGDGTIDDADLLIVLFNFGRCY
jgi:hypothetical protein